MRQHAAFKRVICALAMIVALIGPLQLVRAISPIGCTRQEEADESGNILDKASPQLPRLGADSLVVTIQDSRTVWLKGIKEDRTLWRKRFPLKEEVNWSAYKTSCLSSGRTLTLYSEAPFSAFAVVQTFRWDGKALRFLSRHTEDPSQEQIDAMIRAAEQGNAREAIDTADIMYAMHYINSYTLAGAIKRGHAVALRLAGAGRYRAAANRLALMFDTTVALAEQIAVDGPAIAHLRKWLHAWKDVSMTPDQYVGALNDYGYFLQEAGDHRAALPVFKAVIKAAHDRTVTYLNLADSLWQLGRESEAKPAYLKYQTLMTQKGKQEKIPARVLQRLK